MVDDYLLFRCTSSRYSCIGPGSACIVSNETGVHTCACAGAWFHDEFLGYHPNCSVPGPNFVYCVFALVGLLCIAQFAYTSNIIITNWERRRTSEIRLIGVIWAQSVLIFVIACMQVVYLSATPTSTGCYFVLIGLVIHELTEIICIIAAPVFDVLQQNPAWYFRRFRGFGVILLAFVALCMLAAVKQTHRINAHPPPRLTLEAARRAATINMIWYDFFQLVLMVYGIILGIMSEMSQMLIDKLEALNKYDVPAEQTRAFVSRIYKLMRTSMAIFVAMFVMYFSYAIAIVAFGTVGFLYMFHFSALVVWPAINMLIAHRLTGAQTSFQMIHSDQV